MNTDPTMISKHLKGTLAELLGIRFVEASPNRVMAQLAIRDDLRTVGGALHGGTLMALADTVGAAATMLNLPQGASTATLEVSSAPRRLHCIAGSGPWCGRRASRTKPAAFLPRLSRPRWYLLDPIGRTTPHREVTHICE